MSSYCEVIFYPEMRKVEVPAGTTLLEAARKADLHLEAQCNGLGTCGKCRVKAEGTLTPPDEKERGELGPLMEKGIRLACKAGVLGAVRVEWESDSSFSTVEKGETVATDLNPGVRVIPLPLDTLPVESGTPWWDQLQGKFHMAPERAGTLLARFAEVCNNSRKTTPLAVVRGRELIDIGQDDQKRCLGIALDIGTTSMVAEMVDLATGETVGLASSLNPQVTYGGDVLTRITYASNESDGTSVLQAKVVEGINGLIARLSESNGISPEEIYEMTVAANTTMLHLLMGVSPVSMAVSPYNPVFIHQMRVKPHPLGIQIASGGSVTLMPSASAFVGSDIISGLVATGFHRLESPAVFIDIGTNGEIVTNNRGILVGSSSAAGPALEGMNISCGSRAENGAVEEVFISESGELRLKTIGNHPPRGLCGSGLVDMIAQLVKNGVIEPSGRFAPREKLLPRLAERLITVDDKPAFLISEEHRVTLSQKDIRQVQLAKGAIAAGISLLLQEQGLTSDTIEHVFVAGAFGAHLKPESLIAIGLLPARFRNKIRFVGNTSKEGAKALLLNSGLSAEIQSICEKLTIRELSSLPEFQNCFVGQLGFPVTEN